MNALEWTSAMVALANAIAYKLTPSEIAFLASLFVQLGDTMATIAAQQALKEEQRETQTGQQSLRFIGFFICLHFGNIFLPFF